MLRHSGHTLPNWLLPLRLDVRHTASGQLRVACVCAGPLKSSAVVVLTVDSVMQLLTSKPSDWSIIRTSSEITVRLALTAPCSYDLSRMRLCPAHHLDFVGWHQKCTWPFQDRDACHFTHYFGCLALDAHRCHWKVICPHPRALSSLQRVVRLHLWCTTHPATRTSSYHQASCLPCWSRAMGGPHLRPLLCSTWASSTSPAGGLLWQMSTMADLLAMAGSTGTGCEAAGALW